MLRIAIAESAAEFACADGDTLLRAGLRAGLGLSYECNSGACGTCKVELIRGEVTNLRPDTTALNDRDRAKNRVLSCQSVPRGDCTISARVRDEWIPPVRPTRFTATLVAVRDLTHDIREFRLRADTTVTFLPGQYAMLAIEGVGAPRAYSMSNVPDATGEWHFQIKRVPRGRATTELFENTTLGRCIALDGPFGRGYLQTSSPRDLLCVAGGSGVSPMLSIARGWAREAALANTQLHFFYGGRGPADICGEPELLALAVDPQRMHFYPVISMPEPSSQAAWKGERGFVHELVQKTLGSRLPEFECYFAGPPPMTQATQRMLMQHKVPYGQMHFDSFF